MGWNLNWFRRRNVYLPLNVSTFDELKCTLEDDTILGAIEDDTIYCTLQDEQVTGMVQEETIQGYVQNEEINQNIE